MFEVFYLDKALKRAEKEDISNILGKYPLWIDVTGITKKEKDQLEKVFNLHPITSEDIFMDDVRVKVEEFNTYLFCVFYGICFKEKIRMIELDYIIGDKFLVTAHKEPIDSYEKLKLDEEKLSLAMSKGSDFLFHRLLDGEVDNYPPVLSKLDETIEDLEESVLMEPNPEKLKTLMDIKRKIVSVKRIVQAQKEKISFLAKNDYHFISKKAVPYFRDVYDHSIRVTDSIDNSRELVSNAYEVYMSTMSNNMNQIMKVLSIIATIALPLTVVSGIYGTNFSHLPGQDFHYGFWIMVGIMASMMGIMLYYFRTRKWI